MKFVFLILHILLGVSGTILATIALHYSIVNNTGKMIRFAFAEFVATSLALLAAALYYIRYYQDDKHIIISGKLPMAHSVFMEVKEHSFILFFLLSLYFQLRIKFTDTTDTISFKKETEMVFICIIFLGLLMSAMGIMVNMGFRVNQ